MLSARFEPEAAQTEGGEALPVGAVVTSDPRRGRIDQNNPGRGSDLPGAHWYALWTRSHCERLVHDQLIAKGFDAFLPTIDIWSRRGAVPLPIHGAIFPRGLFFHLALGNTRYIHMEKTRGGDSVAGGGCGRLGSP